MRMCGHAHHDDMLYLGRDPQTSWDYPAAGRAGLRRPRALRVLGGARSDRALRREAARPRASSKPGDLDRFKREAEALVEDARRARSSTRRGRSRRRPASACSRTRSRACTSRCSIPDGPARSTLNTRTARRSRRPPRFLPDVSRTRRRSIRRAAPFSTRSCSASATRCAPIRACSSTARTSAASTATRSCCCGRCSRSSAIASSTRRSPRARCSASASARRWPGSGRSARSSSTTSSRPASISS